MAKGGARAGAGRKKKSLSDQILEGNTGHRGIKQVKFPNSNTAADSGSIYLLPNGAETGGSNCPSTENIRAALVEFVERSGCEYLISAILIDSFANAYRSYLEAEYVCRTRGRIANSKRSPFVQMSLDYNKQAMSIYAQIWSVISQNSTEKFEGKNEFLELLSSRGF
jgi:hypothetical protein